MMHLVRESAAAAREASLSNSSRTYTFTCTTKEHEVNECEKERQDRREMRETSIDGKTQEC